MDDQPRSQVTRVHVELEMDPDGVPVQATPVAGGR